MRQIGPTTRMGTVSHAALAGVVMTLFSGRLLIRNVSTALSLWGVSVFVLVWLPGFGPGERREGSAPESRPIRPVSEPGERTVAERARQALERAKNRAGKPDFLVVADDALEEFGGLAERLEVEDRNTGRLFADAGAFALEIGRSLEQSQRFEEARTQYGRGLAWARRAFPRGHPMTVYLRGRLAAVERTLGDYAQARRQLQAAREEARGIGRGASGRGRPPLQAAILNELGVLARAEGSYREAISYYRLALNAFRETLPPGDPRMAVAHNNLAIAFQWHGDYEGSREHFENAYKIYQDSNAEDVTSRADAAMVGHSLAGLLQTQGDYELAAEHYEKALDVLRECYARETHPDGHPRLATACTSLGMLYTEVGEPGRAIPFHREALEMRQRLFGVDRPHPDVASSLRHLGNSLRASGEFDAAGDLLDRAVDMKRMLGSEESSDSAAHPFLAESLRDRGTLHAAVGQWGLAEASFREAAEGFERVFPVSAYPVGHPDLAACLSDLGEAQFRQGEYHTARENLERSVRMSQQFAEQFLEAAAEAEARNYAVARLGVPPSLFRVWQELDVPASEQYDLVWGSRRVMQRVLSGRQRWHETVGHEAPDGDAVRELIQLREQLSALSLLPPESLPRQRTARLKLLRELTSQKEQLERQLSKLRPSAGSSEVTPRWLGEHLAADTAWIDLVESRGSLSPIGEPERRYIAYVGHQGKVSRVDLGTAPEIEKLLEAWEWAIRRQRDAPVTASEMARLVWVPIAHRLPATVTKIYLCPDGILSRVAWSALPGDDGKPLVFRLSFRLVPSIHWLATKVADDRGHPINRTPGFGPVLLVGDIEYGTTAIDAESTPEAGDHGGARSDVVDDVRRLADRPHRTAWERLPGSAAEISRIGGRLLTGSSLSPPELTTLSGSAASAAAVLESLESSRMAHLATHGFFLTHEAVSPSPGQGVGAITNDLAYRRNPLLASGLVLAGGNDAAGHGIVLAETIASRPMPDLWLVVLSACDSGSGRLLADEGVYGLQQAFHLAGARNVIASRWKVDDWATMELMTRFYDHLIAGSFTVPEALREAQLEMIREFAPVRGTSRGRVRLVRPAASEKTSAGGDPQVENDEVLISPYFWAGFVASGA